MTRSRFAAVTLALVALLLLPGLGGCRREPAPAVAEPALAPAATAPVATATPTPEPVAAPAVDPTPAADASNDDVPPQTLPGK